VITAVVFDTKPYDCEHLQHEALSDIARTTIANLEALAAGKPFVERSVLT
jgi:hypothetical protein